MLETVNTRTRSVGCAVRRPYSDSDESDNDVLYAEEHDTTVQQVSRRKGWLTQTTNNSCGEGCTQLDDLKWFLPAEERAGDLTAPESEIEMSDSQSEVEYIEPDSIPVQTETTAQQLLCPPVVAQTRHMEGCHTALLRQLCRGRDVLMEDGAVAVDTRQASTASEIHRKSECGPAIVPTLAAAPQNGSEVVQPKPRDYCYMNSLPPVGECLNLPSIYTPDAGESGMEMASGNPPADIDICVVLDVLPTAISVRTVVSDKSMEIDTPDAVVSSMEVAGVDISGGPDVLQTAVSVTTEMSVNIYTPDTVKSGIQITGESPPAVSDISVNTDVQQTVRSVTTQMSEKGMMIDSPNAVDSGMEMAGGSPPAEFDISVGPDVLLTAISVTMVVSEKWMKRFVMDLDAVCSDG